MFEEKEVQLKNGRFRAEQRPEAATTLHDSLPPSSARARSHSPRNQHNEEESHRVAGVAASGQTVASGGSGSHGRMGGVNLSDFSSLLMENAKLKEKVTIFCCPLPQPPPPPTFSFPSLCFSLEHYYTVLRC